MGCVPIAISFCMKVCIFVDGENFRHSIVELFPQFRQEDYLPKTANWTHLSDWIVKSIAEDGERIRTYWYVIKSIDFFPYRFPNPEKSNNPDKVNEELRNLLSHHEPYKKELDGIADSIQCAKRMKEIVSDLRKRQDTLQKRFDGWTQIQENISLNNKAIEFRRAGAMTCNLFENRLGREKAVDVKLASDIITLNEVYDMAIIVSGDQDYIPAVEIVKDYGKRVVNVAFVTRSGHLLPGGARRLNQVTDWRFNIPFNTLSEHLNISQLPLKTTNQPT